MSDEDRRPRVLVGGGGREHASLQAPEGSPQSPELLCAPGNAGTRASPPPKRSAPPRAKAHGSPRPLHPDPHNPRPPDAAQYGHDHLTPSGRLPRSPLRATRHLHPLTAPMSPEGRKCPPKCVGIGSRREIDVEHNHNQVG
jgi:hypothetical protein